jgi:hypothetical protein
METPSAAVAMETEPTAAASSQLPIASAVPAPPLFVSVPASRLLRMPAVLLLKLANEFLEDEDVQKLAQTCSGMPQPLRSYGIKAAVSLFSSVFAHRSLSAQLSEQLFALPASLRLLLSRAVGQSCMAETDHWLARMRFGAPMTVFLDGRANKAHLAAQLQRLSLSVRNVRVWQEAFETSKAQSKLAAVALQLPAHIRSLVFEHGWYSPYDLRSRTLQLLPPPSQWNLPAVPTQSPPSGHPKGRAASASGRGSSRSRIWKELSD